MKRNNKKGFTIVELVIVIAVIAILAAVLIPTFAGIVKKANLSADKQAVRQMNTLLSVYDTDGTIKTVADAVAALDKENLELENYKALTKDHYFYFVLDENNNGRIILADKDGNVVYPEDFKAAAGAQWMSLSGMVPMSDDYDVAADGSVAVDNGAELVHLMEAVKNNKETVSTITLPKELDLMGAATDFGTVKTNITLVGAEGGTTLKGVRSTDNAVSPTTGEYAGHTYGYGIFGDIVGKDVKVTIKDVTFSNIVVGNTIDNHENGANTTGLIAGYVKDGATLEMINVTIDNSVVNGYQKVGAIVGQNLATVILNNVKVTNTTVNGHTEVAKVAGIVSSTATLTVTDCDFTGVTVKSYAANQFKKADLACTDPAVVGADTNTFFVAPGKYNLTINGVAKEVSIVFGAVTEDLAWYSIGGSFADDTRTKVTVNGAECYLNGYTASK